MDSIRVDYIRKRREFGRPVDHLTVTEPRVLAVLPPLLASKTQDFLQKTSQNLEVSCIPKQSEHEVNTERVISKNMGVLHMEGGWPKDIDPTEKDQTQRYRKKVEKDETYIKEVKAMGDAVESLWYGQHNAELFGESTLLLFDNAQGGPFPEISSVKRVDIDAAAGTATLAWSYYPVDGYPSAARFPAGYAEVFGDADLLPNGNVLATWWPRHLAPADGIAFDAQLVQITPDKDVAWSLDFSNTGRFVGACEHIEDDGCERLVRAGWKVYSAEHFYDGPRASRATLDGSRLSFFAHAPFKRNAQAPGSWSLETAAGGVVASGELQFPAHFREAAFEVDAAAAVDGAPYVLAVADVDGHRFAVDVDVVS